MNIAELPIQLTQSGPRLPASAEALQNLAARFRQEHCIQLPSFLETGLLRLLQREVEQAEFYQRVHAGIGVEVCMANNNAAGLLHFLTNSPALFQMIRTITGCGPIGCFAGRVYRMNPGEEHYDSWHDDIGENRLVAMSVNLSPQSYSGGIFELRDRRSTQILCRSANVGFGDAIVFHLAPGLQHRVTKVIGDVPKTAFAGWFRSEPDFHSVLKEPQMNADGHR